MIKLLLFCRWRKPIRSKEMMKNVSLAQVWKKCAASQLTQRQYFIFLTFFPRPIVATFMGLITSRSTLQTVNCFWIPRDYNLKNRNAIKVFEASWLSGKRISYSLVNYTNWVTKNVLISWPNKILNTHHIIRLSQDEKSPFATGLFSSLNCEYQIFTYVEAKMLKCRQKNPSWKLITTS